MVFFIEFLPFAAFCLEFSYGQNLCSDIKTNFDEHRTNVNSALQQLETHLQKLEEKIDSLTAWTAIVNTIEPLPIDCEDVREKRQESTIDSGLYLIQVPNLLKRRIYCNFTEQETWTTISRRIHSEDIFNRTWIEYKYGFGKANGDYWIGNEMLNKLTTSNNYYLRITMKGFRGMFISSYKSFKVEDEKSQYRLLLGDYDTEQSNGGDSFFPNADCNKNKDKSASFSTYDFGAAKNCSKTLSGGWWFTDDCGCSNLNGKYVAGGSVPTKGPNMGIYWETLYYSIWKMKSSLRSVVMEIKRI